MPWQQREKNTQVMQHTKLGSCGGNLPEMSQGVKTNGNSLTSDHTTALTQQLRHAKHCSYCECRAGVTLPNMSYTTLTTPGEFDPGNRFKVDCYTNNHLNTISC